MILAEVCQDGLLQLQSQGQGDVTVVRFYTFPDRLGGPDTDTTSRIPPPLG